MPSTTVIIRVRNEEQWIGHAIQSVLDHIENPRIIIVDNKSTDNSIRIASLFKHDTDLPEDKRYTDIDILDISDYTPGKALNIAVKKTITQDLLILSSHCQICHYSISKVRELLNNHVCVFGKQIPIYYGKKINPRYLWSHFVDSPINNMFSSLENRYFLHNAFAAYRTDSLLEFPFNENIQGKEDRYWANKVIDLGLTTFYEPSLLCHHHFTENGNTWKGIG